MGTPTSNHEVGALAGSNQVRTLCMAMVAKKARFTHGSVDVVARNLYQNA